MAWWHENRIRMIQNNLRDIDARMDIDRHIEWLKYFHANVLQIGCGGITSFYPTRYTNCQWINPYMEGDFIGEVIEKAHRSGIRVIVRFDFSKTHESFYEQNPGWYQRSLDGSPIPYHDTYAACLNGEYQQKWMLPVIEEVMRKYPVDGIFFNMFGYQTRNYSGEYVGICQCEGCRRRFREMFGEELPTKEDQDDPVFQKYREFKELTVNEIVDRIVATARSVSPEIAVSSYDPERLDIVRDESNSAVDRPLPFWIYNSSDNVGIIEGSYDDKVSSNVAINAVDIPYRFMGVSDRLNRIRLYGDMASGGNLDWCVIGSFDDYTDYENFEGVRRVFAFHEMHERYFGRFDPKTRILLVTNGRRHAEEAEYRGIFRMLKEEHLPFTCVRLQTLESKLPELNDYDFIILPDVASASPGVVEALAKTSACVVAAKHSLAADREATARLFGVSAGEYITDVRGTYFKAEPKADFPMFHERKWIYLDKPYYSIRLTGGTKGLLPKIEKARFGPPERCFGHAQTDESLAASANGNLYIPWAIGSLYYEHGYEEFKKVFLGLLRSVRPVRGPVLTDAPEMVEMFYARLNENTYMLQFINLTGFNGMTFFDAPRVDFEARFLDIVPASVTELCDEGEKEAAYTDKLSVSMQKSELYKAYLIRVSI